MLTRRLGVDNCSSPTRLWERGWVAGGGVHRVVGNAKWESPGDAGVPGDGAHAVRAGPHAVPWHWLTWRMRSHGVTDFPDPTIVNGQITFAGRAAAVARLSSSR